jgi:glycosyltransferase involved in cell wall biosynthesis
MTTTEAGRSAASLPCGPHAEREEVRSGVLDIALVSEHASPLATLGTADAGGQNVYVDALARGLGALGHRVVVYTRRDDPSLPVRVPLAPDVSPDVMVEHVDAGPPRHVDKDELWPWMPQFAEVLRSRLGVRTPDVVHTHFWMSGAAGGAVATDLGVPWVHTFHALGVVKRRHQGAADRSPADRLRVEHDQVRTADRIVATCTDELCELAAMGMDRRRVDVVPCGIDTAVFRPDGAAAPRGTRPRLATVCRLVPRKGVADVIRAMAELPGVELVVAGGLPRAALETDAEHRRLRDLARAHGVEDSVVFTGSLSQREVAELLRSADVSVCTPAYEPFGIAPIEAMACGTPVVGSAVGGLLDTVVPGQTGTLVPPGRPDRIAAAVRALLGDEPRRARMARQCAAIARDRYDWACIVERIVESYRTAIDQRARSGSWARARRAAS